MKSSIVFFDTSENGIKGTLRGLVIFPIFILFTISWFLLTKKIYNKHIDEVNTNRLIFSMIITALLIVSMLGIHNPSTCIKAIVYGALSGLVVYGIANMSLLASTKKWSYSISLLDTLWGVINTSLLAYILYKIVEKWPSIFNVV